MDKEYYTPALIDTKLEDVTVNLVKNSRVNLDVLQACYCCGRVGCSVSKCPYILTAKPLGVPK